MSSAADQELRRRRRRFYDSTARLYTATFPLIWRIGFPGLHAWLRAELWDAELILDAGAGPGYWSRYLARVRRRRTLVALDFSEAYIQRARRFVPVELGVKLVQADLTIAPFPDRRFDAVLCSGVLDTLPDPDLALQELRRVLRDGGKLLLIVRGKGALLSPLIERAFRYSIALFGFFTGRSRWARADPNLWSRAAIWPRLPELAGRGGFEITDLMCGRMVTRAVLVATDSR
jgi:ubiquinone/menaquinone biosynthesis C-methylase UbiE